MVVVVDDDVVDVPGPPGPVYGGATVGSDGEGRQVVTCKPFGKLYSASGPA